MRGLAVLMVYLYHYGGGLKSPHTILRTLGYATQSGWTGVTLFFALSGFLITGSLWDSFSAPRWLPNFYIRRALRIFPLYYAALILVVILGLADGARFSELKPVSIYFFFAQDLPALAERATAVLTVLPLYHLWSLAVEEQFYLLWPILLFLAHKKQPGSHRRALNLCLAVFAFAELFRLAVYGFPGYNGSSSPTLFDSFLFTHAGALALGAALAIAIRGDHWPRVQKLALPVFLLAAATCLTIGVLTGTFLLNTPLHFTVALPAVEIASAAAIPLLLRPGIFRSLASITPLRWLGRISYGFYVFHILLQPIFDAIAQHTTHTSYGSAFQTVRLVAAFPITIAVAWLSYEFFELPLLRLNRRFPLHAPLPEK